MENQDDSLKITTIRNSKRGREGLVDVEGEQHKDWAEGETSRRLTTLTGEIKNMRETFESEVKGCGLEDVEQRNKVFADFRRKTAFELVKSCDDPASKLEFLQEIGR